MQSDASATPQARRHARTEARLREALARLLHDGSRRLIAGLKNQLRQLATQNAALLKRALNAEAKAVRLDRRASQLTREIDEMHRPVPLRVKETT